MKKKILYVERKPSEFVSIEKIFRSVASNLSDDFEYEFQQSPFGSRFSHIVGNLLFFRKKKADIYHITGHVHYLALLFSPLNTILTIHDIGFLYRPHGFRRWVVKKLFLDWPVKRLKFITAISEHTKNEIVRFTGCPGEKITVIDDPLLIEPMADGDRQFNQTNPTILQVGTAENKNVPNIARALRGIDCNLRIIGRMHDRIALVLAENGINFENGLELTHEQMLDEYKKADLVTFCSTHEGFGLPIIEAQAMRKPVITSNISPMAETSGGAAVLVDPNDPDSIRAGIQKVIRNTDYRNDLIEAGLENIKRFAPQVVAEKYEDYYKKILSTGSKSDGNSEN